MTFEELQYAINALAGSPDATPAQYLSYHQVLEREPLVAPDYFRQLRAAFLGSFTLQGLPEIFRTRAFLHNLLIETYTAAYNQFTQEALDVSSGLSGFRPDLVFLLVDAADFLDEAHAEQVVRALRGQTDARIVIALPAASPRLPADRAAGFERRLREFAAGHERVHLFDLGAFLDAAGRENYWYTKYTDVGDFRIAPQAFPALAEELLGFAVAAAGAARKCLVLDCDNTLWSGIVGEDGSENVVPNRSLQEHVLGLTRQGVILALASANNEEDALSVFERHPAMLIRPEHLAAWRINWEPKEKHIEELADELGIGTESIVFVDDDPLQRERVSRAFPGVAALPPEALPRFAGFVKFETTVEDSRRGAMYREERSRREFKKTFGSVEDFLRSLKLEVRVRPASEEILGRLSQLTQKTNQFNATTRRYSPEDLTERMGRGWRVWGVEVRDAFGDYGLTGVCIVKPEERDWVIDTYLLSCRVLGREVERALLGYVCEQASACGAERIVAEFIPTKKNKPCESFFANAGFRELGEREGSFWYARDAGQPFGWPGVITLAADPV